MQLYSRLVLYFHNISIVVKATEAKDFLVASDKLRVAQQLSIVGIAVAMAILLCIFYNLKGSSDDDDSGYDYSGRNSYNYGGYSG